MRHPKGFTLVELLVVIAIIAVLMGILMPALRKVKQQGRATVCQSNLRNIGLAVLMYTGDFEDRIPDTGRSNGHLWDQANGDPFQPGSDSRSYWGTFYRPYIKETELFGCPSLRRVPEGLIYDYTGYPDPAKVVQHAAYGLNHHERARGRKLSSIFRQAEFLYASDHAEPRPDGSSDDCFHNNDKPGTLNLTQYREGGSRAFSYRQIFRHNVTSGQPFRTGGQANILWIDGHVTALHETTGDNVPVRWYTGDRP